MGIDLRAIKPHQVSRDLRGYTIFIYAPPKTGKTTFAASNPKSLVLAFEKGYLAIPGVMAQPINSWGEFKQVLFQLADESMHDMFDCVAMDTVDIAWSYLEKYICANNGVDKIGEIPYGQGYSMMAKEYDETIRKIVQLNYGLIMISHDTDKTFTDENGKEYNKIVPTLPEKARIICSRAADLYGYARIVTDADGNEKTKLFLRGTQRYEAGSRFKYIDPVVDFTYNAVTKAINDAIDKQMAETKNDTLFTDENQAAKANTAHEIDYDAVMNELTSVFGKLMDTNPDFFQPRITQIIEKYLGKGKKVSEASRDQTEALSLILTEVKAMLD